MATTDDFGAHDGPICTRCESCNDCCECPPRWHQRFWPAFAIAWLVPLSFGAFLVFGVADFASGWGFLAGLTLTVVSNRLDTQHWAVGWLVFLSGVFAFHLFAPDAWSGSFLSGIWLPMALIGAVMGTWLGVVKIGLWRDRRATDDELTREAKDGIDKIGAYLDGHRTITDAAAAHRQRIIGLWGYAGAGKDTAAAELMFRSEGEYTRVSFADPIRALALAVNTPLVIRPGDHGYDDLALLDGAIAVVTPRDLVESYGGDWVQAKRVPAMRAYLQGLGVGVRDVLGENTWVDKAMRDLPDCNIVVTDCRFPNEAQAITDAGGYIVRIDRPGVEAANGHVTDTALEGWEFDAAIVNDGTPADARLQMRRVEEVLYDPDLYVSRH